MHPRISGPTSGLSLLELIVAIVVLSLGALAATRATDQSRLAIGGAQDRILAQIAATNRAEELHLLANQIEEQRLYGAPTPLPPSVSLGGQTFTLTQAEQTTAGGLRRVQITARSQRGAGAVFVTYLPKPQLVLP